MIRYCGFLVTVWMISHATGVIAQSKVVPVTKSELTGTSLPTGSKKDNRLLAVAAAQALLQMEAKDNAIVLAESIEVFSLPPSTTKESEKFVLQEWQATGWHVASMTTSNYYLLTRSGIIVMAYLQTFSKETALYVCPVQSMPVEKNIAPSPPQQTEQQTTVTPTTASPSTTSVSSAKQASPTGFAFTTTNFDDGWVATVHENWVEVVKNNLKVLLHHHTQATSEYISDYRVEDQLAWNTFIVPRYGNIPYLEAPGTVTFERPHYLYAHATEPQSRQPVYVVLFSMGSSGWMEFIAPNQTTFTQVFGVDVTKMDSYFPSSGWDPLRKMSGYNKFAVAAADLTGKWSSSFGGFVNYVNVYTGSSAGTNTHSSAENFVFNSNVSYEWSLGVASGMVGNIKFSSAASTGTFTMPNNWQIHFSEIEKKPRLYNAYFSCVRGGASLLWLQDTGYGDYKSFGKE